MKRFRGLVLPLAIAATVWGSCPDAWADEPVSTSAIKSFDFSDVTAIEGQLADSNLVSSVLPAQDELKASDIENLAASYKQEGDRFGVKVNSVDGDLLVSKAIPDWYQARSVEDLSHYVGFINEFAKPGAKRELNQAKTTNVSNLKAILAAFALVGAPPQIRENKNRQLTERLAEDGAQIQLFVGPELYFYEKETGKFLGKTRFEDGKPLFQAAIDGQNTVSTTHWIKPPALIQPDVELLKADAQRAIQLQPARAVWTVADLVALLGKQGVKFEKIEPVIEHSKVYISQQKEWTVGQLLQAVCAVGGYEVRQVPAGYWLQSSKAHQNVADNLSWLVQGAEEQQKVLAALNNVFPANDPTLDLQFDRKYFQQSAPIDINALEADAGNKALAPVSQNLRDRVGQVLFTISLGCRIQSPTGSNNQGTDIAAFAPAYDLNPPANWTAFHPEDFLELYKAKITL